MSYYRINFYDNISGFKRTCNILNDFNNTKIEASSSDIIQYIVYKNPDNIIVAPHFLLKDISSLIELFDVFEYQITRLPISISSFKVIPEHLNSYNEIRKFDKRMLIRRRWQIVPYNRYIIINISYYKKVSKKYVARILNMIESCQVEELITPGKNIIKPIQ